MPARNPTVCDKHRAVLLSRCLISWCCCPTRTGDQLITNQAVFIDSLKEPREICPKLTLPYPAGNLRKTVILRVVWLFGTAVWVESSARLLINSHRCSGCTPGLTCLRRKRLVADANPYKRTIPLDFGLFP